MRRTHLLIGVLACACAALCTYAPTAWAHAQLLGTSPLSGTVVQQQPQEVIFKFNQAVGGTLGAVRVYNAQGEEVDDLDVSHPEGQEHWMGVGLKPGLPDGTYTATYRVISADTHIVYGGLVFSIGHAGPAPKVTVAGLISRNKSGEVTEVAIGTVRSLDYLSLALFIGGLAFLLVAWLPGLAAVMDTEPDWQAASQAFAKRLHRLLTVAVVLGMVVSVLGILLQGASAAGVSLWSSLKGTVIENTLNSRFGEVWGARAIDWQALGVALAFWRRGERSPSPPDHRPARTRQRLSGDHPRAGWAREHPEPNGGFLSLDVLHVLAASVWVGGIACLLGALPAATRQLQGPDRSRLLLATLARFSPLALGAVVVIAVTGVVQAYIDVRSIEGLLHTTYGALILVKVALLVALIGLGWVNRERAIPALKRIANSSQAPGTVGMLARRTMRGELALMLCVFGVTAALISYAPPIDAASGPFATNTTLGPIELEMTLEPAKVGLNTVHLYLINAKDGTQFTGTKELVVTADLPSKGIGPLPLQANVAGPGHYVLSSAELSPGGDMGDPDHRQGLRIRRVQPHSEGPNPMTGRKRPGRTTAAQEQAHQRTRGEEHTCEQ